MTEDDGQLAEASEHVPVPRLDAVAVTAYSGPLPPPEVLARFERLYPGSAKLIIDDFLSESLQRREAERHFLRSTIFRHNLGAVSASLLGLIGVAGGLWLAYVGRSLSGLSSVLGTLATLLAIFLYQRRTTD